MSKNAIHATAIYSPEHPPLQDRILAELLADRVHGALGRGALAGLRVEQVAGLVGLGLSSTRSDSPQPNRHVNQHP